MNRQCVKFSYIFIRIINKYMKNMCQNNKVPNNFVLFSYLNTNNYYSKVSDIFIRNQ